MTLDEAIRHAENVAEENEKSLREWKECKNRGTVGWSDFDKEKVDTSIARCSKCAEEHRQLAEWLKELKQLREINEKLIKEYISKVERCDECFASIYCIVNGLRKSRVPQDYCVKNIKRNFRDKVSPIGQK